MKTRWIAMIGIVGTFALVTACSATSEDPVVGPEQGTLGPAAKRTSAQLNLSHIECTATGVNAHFVLLFTGSATPGTLTGTYNGGTFSGSPEKNTGNVWHYNIPLPSGYIDILSATVDGVSLHNPGEYAGDYQCTDIPQCSVQVASQDVYCSDSPLKNPGSECGAFGLEVLAKDDGLSGLTWTATHSALLAIVKSGTHGCGPGQSAYRVYANVTAGDTLSTPADQGISHVTYCACPD
jgi:hypothetical protein